jgi:glycosyltransferase involved in cell wall biosynthesis
MTADGGSHLKAMMDTVMGLDPAPPRPVVMLSQYMYPERNSTGELLTSLATGLAASGFPVTAYCAQPTYFAGSTPVDRTLVYEGVVIHRLWTTRLGRARLVTRLVDALTFAVACAVRLTRLPRGAIVLTVTNPPFIPLIAALRRRFSRNSFVLLVHDVYPEAAVQLKSIGQGSVLHRVWRVIDHFTLRQADRIVVLGVDMGAVVASKMAPGHEQRIVVIPNWADDGIAPIPKEQSKTAQRYGLVDTFVVQYSGNVGLSQSLEVVLEAAVMLAADDVTFTVVGEGVNLLHLKALAESRDLRNVRFIARVPHELLADSLAACDVALVPLARGMEGLSVPSKYYSALASGRPILAVMDPHAEVARSVVDDDCGLVVPQWDASSIADSVRRLQSDPELLARLGRNARQAFERLYTRDRAISEYIAVLSSLNDAARDAPIKSGNRLS